MAPPVLDINPDDPALVAWCETNAIPHRALKANGKSVNPHAVSAALRNLSHYEAVEYLLGKVGAGAFVVMFRGNLRNENDLKNAGLLSWSLNPEGVEPGSASQNRPLNSCECTIDAFVQGNCTHMAGVQGNQSVAAFFLPDSDYLLDPAGDPSLMALVQAMANKGAPIVSTGVIPSFDPVSAEPFAEFLPGADCPKVEGWQGLVERNGEWQWLAAVEGNSFGYHQKAPKWWFEPVPGFTLVNSQAPAYLARVELKRWAKQGVFVWNLVANNSRPASNPSGSHVVVTVDKSKSNMVDAFDFVPIFFTREAWQNVLLTIRQTPPHRVNDAVARTLVDANKQIPQNMVFAYDAQNAVDAILRAASPRLSLYTVQRKFETMLEEAKRQVAQATAVDWGAYAVLVFLHIVASLFAGTVVGFVALAAVAFAGDLLDWVRVMHVDVLRHTLRFGITLLGTFLFFLPGVGRFAGGVDRFVVYVVAILVDVYATKTRRTTGPSLDRRRLAAALAFAVFFTAFWAYQPGSGSDTLTAGFWEAPQPEEDALSALLGKARGAANHVKDVASPYLGAAMTAGGDVLDRVGHAAHVGLGYVGGAASVAASTVASTVVYYQPIDTPAGRLCFSSVCSSVTGLPFVEEDPLTILRDPIPRCLTALCEYQRQIPVKRHGPYFYGGASWCAPGDFVCALEPGTQMVNPRFLEPQPIRINGRYVMGCSNELCNMFTSHPRQGMFGAMIVRSTWSEIAMASAVWILCTVLCVGPLLWELFQVLKAWEPVPSVDSAPNSRADTPPGAFRFPAPVNPSPVVLTFGTCATACGSILTRWFWKTTGCFREYLPRVPSGLETRRMMLQAFVQLVCYYALWGMIWGIASLTPLSTIIHLGMVCLFAPLMEERLGVFGRLVVMCLELSHSGSMHVLAFRLMVTVPFQLASVFAQIAGTWKHDYLARVCAHVCFNVCMVSFGMIDCTGAPVSMKWVAIACICIGVIIVISANYNLSCLTEEVRTACVSGGLHAPLTCGSVGIEQSRFNFWSTNGDQRAAEQLRAEARKSIPGWLLIGLGLVLLFFKWTHLVIAAFAGFFQDPGAAHDGATYRELWTSLRDNLLFTETQIIGSLNPMLWNPFQFKNPAPPKKANASIARGIQSPILRELKDTTDGLMDTQTAVFFSLSKVVPPQMFAAGMPNVEGALRLRFIKPARLFDCDFNRFMGMGCLAMVYAVRNVQSDGSYRKYPGANKMSFIDSDDWRVQLQSFDERYTTWIPGVTDEYYDALAVEFINNLPSDKKDKWRKAAQYRRTPEHTGDDGEEVVIDARKADDVWSDWPCPVDYSLPTRDGSFQKMLQDKDLTLRVRAFVKAEILALKTTFDSETQHGLVANKPRQIIYPSEYNTVVEQVAIWHWSTQFGQASRATRFCATMGLTALNLGSVFQDRWNRMEKSTDTLIQPLAAGDDSAVFVTDPAQGFDMKKAIKWYKNIGRDPTPRIVYNPWDVTFCSGHFLPVNVDFTRKVVWYNLPGKILSKLLAIMVDGTGDPRNHAKTALKLLKDKMTAMCINHSGNPILGDFLYNVEKTVQEWLERCPGNVQDQKPISNRDEFRFIFEEAREGTVQESEETIQVASAFCSFRYGFSLDEVTRALQQYADCLAKHVPWTVSGQPNAVVHDCPIIDKMLKVDAAGTEPPVGDEVVRFAMEEGLTVVQGLGSPDLSTTPSFPDGRLRAPDWAFLSAPSLDLWKQLLLFWLIRVVKTSCSLMVAIDLPNDAALAHWFNDLITNVLKVRNFIVWLCPRAHDQVFSDQFVVLGATSPDLPLGADGEFDGSKAAKLYASRKKATRWAVLDLFAGPALAGYRQDLVGGVFGDIEGSGTTTWAVNPKEDVAPDWELVRSGVVYYAQLVNPDRKLASGGTMFFPEGCDPHKPQVTTLAGYTDSDIYTAIAVHSPDTSKLSNVLLVSNFGPEKDAQKKIVTKYNHDTHTTANQEYLFDLVNYVALLLFFSTGMMTSKVLGQSEHFLSWAWTLVKEHFYAYFEVASMHGKLYHKTKIHEQFALHPLRYIKNKLDMTMIARTLSKVRSFSKRFFVLENDQGAYDSSHVEAGFSPAIETIYQESGLNVNGARPWKMHSTQKVMASGVVKLEGEDKRQNVCATLRWQLGSGHAFTTILNCITNIIEAYGSTGHGLGLTLDSVIKMIMDDPTVSAGHKLQSAELQRLLAGLADNEGPCSKETEQWLASALQLSLGEIAALLVRVGEGRSLAFADSLEPA